MKRGSSLLLTFALPVLVAAIVVGCSLFEGEGASPDRSEAGIATLVDDADQIPCAPRKVLQTVCQECHARPMRSGAPFPLVTRSDLLASHSGRAIRELAIEQLAAGRMPLAPVPIEYDARASLLAWLRDGAPAVAPQKCEDVSADAEAEPARDAEGAEACPEASDLEERDATPE